MSKILVAGIVLNFYFAVAYAQLTPRSSEVQRFSRALQFQTVFSETTSQTENLAAFHTYLRKSFPKTFARLGVRNIGNALLLAWLPDQAKENSAVLLNAHIDVVPVEEAEAALWKYPPYSGAIGEGKIWGRGAIDNKQSVMAILETTEKLLAAGWAPRRPLYFIFGADEEVGGFRGAKVVAEYFRREKISVAAFFDEGIPVLEDPVPGLALPTALVGVQEKGLLTLSLTVELESGHSSAPPKESAVKVLRQALDRVDAMKRSYAVPEVVEETFRHFGERGRGFKFFLLRHFRWTKHFLLPWVIQKQPGPSTLVSTVCVNTLLRAGIKDNVLARKATATFNCRILPGDTTDRIIEDFRKAVADARVKIEVSLEHFEATPRSSTETEEFQKLSRAIQKTFLKADANSLVTPSLFPASTDSKHFVLVAKNIYRFSPYRIYSRDIALLHGRDEHISLVDFERALDFYRELILSL